ncbi:TetR/AcrR family transcriptional regulator [Sphingobium mellinum]|uniref:TetR/AcrR family transcriptional regulator n=1 Tax=Sphingobium mellinum TaxID=1387166 RepID=UPI0030EEA9C9
MVIGKRESLRLARRAKIIAVAREHFCEHGYAGTAMSAIAAKLGGSKATLWNHFPSKEALLTAVVEDTASALQSKISLPDTGGDPIKHLVRLCRAMVDNAVSPLFIAMRRLIYSEASRQPELANIFHERGTLRGQRLLAEQLRLEFGDILRPVDFVEAARILLSLCWAGLHADMMSGVRVAASTVERDADAAKAATIFLRAYAKDPASLFASEAWPPLEDGRQN